MAENIDTKALKSQREEALKQFLNQIKADGRWRDWLNGQGELHIAKVCKHLGTAEEEGKGKPWDSTCFRGGKWAEPYKEAFNRWIKSVDMPDADLFGNPSAGAIALPNGLSFEGLSDEWVVFIKDTMREAKKQKDEVAKLRTQLSAKETELLMKNTQLNSIVDATKARDEHYLFSIRSLKYDD